MKTVHPHTIIFEVPNTEGLISGCRDQHETAIGCKGQVSHYISMVHQIQQQFSCSKP